MNPDSPDTELAEKWKTICDFVEKEGSGPKQGSEEWLKARFWSIGGASIASYIGRNPHCTPYIEVMRRFPGTVAEPASLAMMWGVLFEPMARAITEQKWGVEIVGHDMMIRYQPGCHYSPDGFSVLRIGGQAPRIVLHEFKCVWSRPMGQMPDYYLPQVLMGLCVSPAEVGLFGQFVFRAVPFRRLAMRNMEVLPVMRGRAVVLDHPNGPTHCGVIRFRPGPGVEIPIGANADIGEMDHQARRILHHLLGLAVAGKCTTEYSPVYPYTDAGRNALIRDHTSGREAPFLVWKMCLAEEYIVERRESFFEQIMRVISPVISTYNYCRELPPSPESDQIIRDRLNQLLLRKKWIQPPSANGVEDVEFQ